MLTLVTQVKCLPHFAKAIISSRSLAFVLCAVCITATILSAPAPCDAAAPQGSVSQAEELYRTGKFAACASMAEEAITGNAWTERWRHLRIKAEMAQGRYAEALAATEEALVSFRTSVAIRLLAYEVYLYNNKFEEAEAMLNQVDGMAIANPQRYTSAESRVALGRFFVLRGADARKVLENFYDYAQRQTPSLIDTYLASAELALSKDDHALAADTLQKAPETAQRDPHYHYLLARSFSTSDPAKVAESVAAALAIDDHHVPTLLLQADKLIDAEQYDAAEELLGEVRKVNPNEPLAWAYHAVIAHLRADAEAEESARDRALANWSKNPEVDWLIGKKLAQKYRFAEGATYQRQSLAFDENYLPAKIQLAQDLLRLGDEDEGWRIANEVFATDGYNILMYNLVTLHDELAGFRTIASDGFLLRMEQREADLYGQQAMDLLRRAKATLCEKYEITIDEPVIVEIFPRQRDFAVRTFGIPGAEGYLGVCFGRVITANSPASQGESPSNWESVLWHEFCHVVTLNKTKNKMPRWFSEGISVYEEMQESPAWGQPLIPVYREMMLSEDLPPMSELSASFMSPKSALHLQFAYFESALAIEFLINEYGFETVVNVLADLGEDKPLDVSLPLRTRANWEELDDAFATFVKQRAAETAAEATWEQPELSPRADSAEISAWLEGYPKSFPGLLTYAAALIREQRYTDAKAPLRELIELYPEYVGGDNAYSMLAIVHRELGEIDEERDVLEELIARDGDPLPAYTRLMEIAVEQEDSQLLLEVSQLYLAVNPLVPAPHRALATAAEETGEVDAAIRALSALSILDDTDPSNLHFRLAQLHYEKQDLAEARRQVLKALEEAPRFLAAHDLLLQIVADSEGPLRAPDPSQSSSGGSPPGSSQGDGDAASAASQPPGKNAGGIESVDQKVDESRNIRDLLYIRPREREDGGLASAGIGSPRKRSHNPLQEKVGK